MENWSSADRSIFDVIAERPKPEELDDNYWTPPKGAVTMAIDVGDAVIWHGNTWHGGWRRDVLGARIKLAAYFCRSHIATRELRGNDRYPEVFQRRASDPRFALLMSHKPLNDWRDESPDFFDDKSNPTGLLD